jgi:phosphoglucosamine mutase
VARLFGTDGVRGAYGADLTDALARTLGYAAARVLASGSAPRILIGRDTRASGPALERALADGIRAAGGVPVSCGVMPTAGVAYLVASDGFAAGAVISASHNPAGDNGIKFFGTDGMKLPDAIEDAIEAEMAAAPPLEPSSTVIGSTEGLAESAIIGGEIDEFTLGDELYLDFLLKDVPSLNGLRIVVDCANGAASNLAPEAYRGAGADVTVLFADPDGTNINAGCGSTHPERLVEVVRRTGAHLGIAHDGDADRMLAVDAHGELVDGDQILGIVALDAAARGELTGNAVVTTVMANIGFRHAMRDAGIELIETAVGDRYVLQAMRERGISMGGEQSGHLIFLERHTTGDGILTALQLLAVIARSQTDLSALAKRIPRFPQVLENVRVASKDGLLDAAAVEEAIRNAEAMLGDTGRVLVRPSGTEPVIRVMAEASNEAAASAAVATVVAAVHAASA